MKLNKKSSEKDTVKAGGCGCGTKHGAADEWEVEETEIEVSK